MKKKDKEQSDLDDVIREETRRGRRPIDIEERRRQERFRREFRMYLRIPTEKEFIEAMLAFGLREDSPQMNEALMIWRTFRES